MDQPAKVPRKAWVVTFAGTAVNLCLGILYAWSVWKAKLIGDADHPAGSPMSGLDEGREYLTDAQAKHLIAQFGLSGSFIGLGIFFAVVVIVAGQLLAWPPARYAPPALPA